MEQIVAFVLGVSAVALVWVVVMTFKTRKDVKELEGLLQYTENYINERDTLVNRRIDQEIDRVDQIANNSMRHTDSRVDKSEARLEARINDLSAFTDLSQHAIEKLQYQLAELQVALENYINKEK